MKQEAAQVVLIQAELFPFDNVVAVKHCLFKNIRSVGNKILFNKQGDIIIVWLKHIHTPHGVVSTSLQVNSLFLTSKEL